MRAVRITEFGTPLTVQQIEEPAPVDGEVVVEILLAGVNPVDVAITSGNFPGTILPLVPGSDGVGTVDGRLVLVRGGGIGRSRPGTFAERVAVPVASTFPIPDGVDPRLAAGLGVPGLTAWRAAVELAGIGHEDRVLVLGAPGGVGLIAAQLALAAGAEVYVQSSNEDKLAHLVARGAHPVVARSAAELGAAGPELPTVVLDGVGGELAEGAIGLLDDHGRYVVYGTPAGSAATLDLQSLYRRNLIVRGLTSGATGPEQVAAAIEGVMGAAAAGQLEIPTEVLALSAADTALRRIPDRRLVGKLLLDPTSDA